MLRTVLIIVALVGVFTWFLTGQAPQRSGTLALQLALDFPPAAKPDLGRTVARILPACPGFASLGGEVIFNTLTTYADTTRMTFTVPEKSRVPKEWGPYDKPCAYEVTGDELRIAEGPCQALCLGKRPEKALDMLVVSLPAAQASQSGQADKKEEGRPEDKK